MFLIWVFFFFFCQKSKWYKTVTRRIADVQFSQLVNINGPIWVCRVHRAFPTFAGLWKRESQVSQESLVGHSGNAVAAALR